MAPARPGGHRERRIRPDPAVALPRGDGAVGAKGAAGTPAGGVRAAAEPAGDGDDGSSCGGDDAGSSDGQEQQGRRRQRGGGRKRRRGRRAEESGEGEPKRSGEKGPGAPGASREEQGGETAGDGEFEGAGLVAGATRSAGKKKPKPLSDDGGIADEKRRYCLGRRPVTDFAVGQECSGTVVYVKPFGVFFDVGCHSDAFCHVSRLDDSYVEDPGARFRPGDAVEAARVVEVDRARKRITVSLQSEGRVADERASIEARQERLRKRRKALPQQQHHHHRGSAAKPYRPAPGRPSSPPPPPGSSPVLGPSSPSAPSRIVSRVADPAASGAEGADAGPPSRAREGDAPTSHDLKRARKLERRAARRAQSEPPPSR
jgi:predicted RNA-binding protein with RPS1 domain